MVDLCQALKEHQELKEANFDRFLGQQRIIELNLPSSSLCDSLLHAHLGHVSPSEASVVGQISLPFARLEIVLLWVHVQNLLPLLQVLLQLDDLCEQAHIQEHLYNLLLLSRLLLLLKQLRTLLVFCSTPRIIHCARLLLALDDPLQNLALNLYLLIE